MKSVTKLAVGSLLLGALAYAQAPSEPAASNATSAIVSAPEGTIKPVPVAPPDVSADADIVADPASLIPDLPRLPQAKATLIGGTVERLDRVRDRLPCAFLAAGR